MINVTIWNEFLNEKLNDEAKRVYPDGIHKALADGLSSEGFAIRTATLRDDAQHGLGEEVLNSTDVLLWWGHKAHDQVSDEVTARVVKRVQEGMGLIVLHSGHFSKPFKALMGTSCNLKWRVAGEQEIIWSVNPSHPIAEGIDAKILLEHEEMYGEFLISRHRMNWSLSAILKVERCSERVVPFIVAVVKYFISARVMKRIQPITSLIF